MRVGIGGNGAVKVVLTGGCQPYCRAVMGLGRSIRLQHTEAKPESSFFPGFKNVRKGKPTFVTTPIFYVNAAPHLGHLHSMILADTIKRWNVFIAANQGSRKSYFITGTDEHGIKVKRAAEEVGKTPRQLVDQNSQKFRDLADKSRIGYNRFIRTTDPDHLVASQALWSKLDDAGYIYKGKHDGWYCVSDETFYPENQVEKVEDEIKGTQMISKETRKPVEWTSEENYFFALSRLREDLLNFYDKNKQFVIPAARHEAVVNEVFEGLEDISISRPTSRCDWGIPVPGDDSQVIYVWLEALANYLTASGFPWSSPDAYRDNVWPADYHIVGKDIVRFHAVYWPAFLIAASIPPPIHVVVHSHWLLSGEKMSKSLGNVVDPMELLDHYEVDTVRFFLLFDSHLNHDTSFDTARVISRHNTELVNKLGNLIMRICSPNFNIPRATGVDVDRALKLDPERYTKLKEAHYKVEVAVNNLLPKVSEHMEKCDTSGALQTIWDLIALANQNLQEFQPWALPGSKRKLQDALIRDAAEIARCACIMLQPFLPDISSRMLDRLGVEPHRRQARSVRNGGNPHIGLNNANRKGDAPIMPLKNES